jgi:hypothetical protein
MGKSTFVFVYCVGAGLTDGSGWGVVTTANGDTIHVSITDLTLDTSVTPPEWSEIETIVGGTGKFENAIGTSFSHGTLTFDTDPFPTEFLPPLSPTLLERPQGWIGTSEGEITF